MFIKINIHVCFNDDRIEVITSSPSECFQLINILDNSNKVIAWNMEEHRPEEFGWMPSTHWNKWKDNFFK